MVQATIVIPTFDHGPMLRESVASALEQTVGELEVFIVGDGVPDAAREIARELQGRDERVRFFDNPKGPRHGEIHRHAALQHARGEIVCYLSDDDLYMPDHVEYMAQLLGRADFAHALALWVGRGEKLGWAPIDISDPECRAREVGKLSLINLTQGAHTLEMYRRLPHGWRTTPRGTSTDHYMWRQFLELPECRAVSAARPTTLGFRGIDYWHLPLAGRVGLMAEWRRRISDLGWRDGLVLEQLMKAVYEVPRLQRMPWMASGGAFRRGRRRLERLLGGCRRSRRLWRERMH
jgi:hypothetical protein